MYARADSIGLPATTSLRSSGSGGGGRPTALSQGPPPYWAATSAAGQAESSKSGCCQPVAAALAAFQEASVTRSSGSPIEPPTWSLAISPAGLVLVLIASIAITLRPACSDPATSTSIAVRQESVTRGELASSCPLI